MKKATWNTIEKNNAMDNFDYLAPRELTEVEIDSVSGGRAIPYPTLPLLPFILANYIISKIG